MLPGPALVSLCPFLPTLDILSLAAGSKALREQYSNKVQRVYLLWSKLLVANRLFDFVRRQERLQVISTEYAENILPCLLPLMSTGHLRHLQKLELVGVRIPFPVLFGFAALLTEDDLPLLEELPLYSCEEGGAVTVMHALQGGTCPRLHTIGIRMRVTCFFLYADGDWEEDLHAPINEEQTDLNMIALAEALEARRHLGTCAPVKQIGDDWMDTERTEVQLRVLRAFLPSAEGIDENVLQADHALVLKEFGAPCLKKLKVRQEISEIMEAFDSMVSLEELTLYLPLNPASYDPFTVLDPTAQEQPPPQIGNITYLALLG